jgi:uncharacterized protein involved in exopolysaccharide biosynthesis
METEVRLSTSLKNILHLIFKRRTQILLVFGATVCTVAIASYMTTPTYEATAQILVKIGREDIYMPTLPGGGTAKPIVSSGRTEQRNSEMEILRSRFLAQRVVESLGPAVIYKDLDGTNLARAVGRFKGALTVQAVKGSNVISLSFKHTNPRLAATAINTLVDLYLERHLEVHKRHDPQGFFQKQYLLLKDQTRLAEEKLQAFRNQNDLTALDEEQSILLRQEAGLRTQLNQSLSQQAEIKNRIQQLRDQQTTTLETIPLNLNDGTMGNLRARLVDLELQEHELLTKYSDQSRLVRRVRAEITMVRRTLGEHRSEIIQQEILRNEADLQALKAKEETQNAQADAIQKRHEKLNRLVLEFDRLRQAVEVHRENYRLYLTKFEEARISDAMDREKIANVRLIEPGHIPGKPVSPNIRLNMILATFLGGSGALGLAYISEQLADSLEKDEDVENLLHVPVLASIPQLER